MNDVARNVLEDSLGTVQVDFNGLNNQAQQQIAAMMQITSIPTLMAFRDGIALFNQAGALPGPALEDLIEQIRAVDMDEVRAEIAKFEEAQAKKK